MRILIVHSRYQSGPVSGENRVVEDEARLLEEGGHEVLVWAPEAETDGLQLIKTGAQTVWSVSAAREVRALIGAHRPDVVHAHNLFPALSPSVLRAARAEGVPVVMTLHNYRLMCLPGTFLRDGHACEDCLGRAPWPGVKYKCHRNSRASSAAYASSLILHRRLKTFDDVSLYLATSEFVRSKHVEAGMNEAKVLVKPNFSWPLEPRSGPGDYFLFLGRLSDEKGAAELLGAWRDIDQKLVVVGDGPDRERVAALACGNVELRPAVPFEDVPDLMRGARAMCVPSLSYEGSPRGILDAYAAGVPVIAHRVGAVPEFVDDARTGFLVEPRDNAGWADAVGRLANDETSQQLGARAHDLWAERYSPTTGLAALEAAYERAAGRAN
jgi:glycosyltransferase involved in cell wall biosynthesis